jgi:hypothetical protein
MRSNPIAAFDKSQASQTHLKASQAAQRLALIALKHVSKRQAKHDKSSCHKARAWRCKGTFAVSAAQVKLSKIDWI